MDFLWRSKERRVIPLINHCVKSRFPNAPLKGRGKRKQPQKSRALRQTKSDIKKKHASIESKNIYTCMYFPSISQRKYERAFVTRFTCSPYVFSSSNRKTFLILSITDIMPSQKKYYIFIHVSNKSDSFFLFFSLILIINRHIQKYPAYTLWSEI